MSRRGCNRDSLRRVCGPSLKKPKRAESLEYETVSYNAQALCFKASKILFGVMG